MVELVSQFLDGGHHIRNAFRNGSEFALSIQDHIRGQDADVEVLGNLSLRIGQQRIGEFVSLPESLHFGNGGIAGKRNGEGEHLYAFGLELLPDLCL